MELFWDALSIVFFFCLVMLGASVFTERTAWFFKEKSRLRGAILWMSAALLCGVLVTECAPRPAQRAGALEKVQDALFQHSAKSLATVTRTLPC